MLCTVYVCVCKYVCKLCVYVSMYACTCVYMYAYMCMYLSIHFNVYISMHSTVKRTKSHLP